MRWDHPTEGRLPPDKFLPAAEDSGFVFELDRWMLREACTRAAEFHRDGHEEFGISVNLSGRTLQGEGIVEFVARVLAETGLPARSLMLEITESVLVQHDAARRLEELQGLGVRLAIDDFGTGYSSLSYLSRFPIDLLKIDKSFVDEVAAESQGTDVTKAIVTLADTLSLRTLAEGIEEEEQRRALGGFGVSLGQGFLFAKPIDDGALRTLLEDGSRTKQPGEQEPAYPSHTLDHA